MYLQLLEWIRGDTVSDVDGQFTQCIRTLTFIPLLLTHKPLAVRIISVHTTITPFCELPFVEQMEMADFCHLAPFRSW